MLGILNVVMRLFTWGFALYRWARKQEKSMLFLSLALWVDFLAALVQKPILENLGVSHDPKTFTPLLALLAVIEAVLLLTTSLYLNERLETMKGQLLLVLASVAGSAYVLLAALFSTSSLLLMAFPMPFMGLSLMITGYTLIRREIEIKSIATLFPVGAFLLGAINITYPVTVNTEIAPYLYGAGAVFRAMMLVGMAKYALFHVAPPKTMVVNIPQGAFYVDNPRYLQTIFHKMQVAGNGVLITRNPPKDETPTFPVFWVTKVVSSAPSENVMIIRPTDIGILVDLVKKHLEMGHSIVVLDCFEYLALENGFESAFKFLLSLKDHVLNVGGTLIVVTDSSTYSEKQWRLIEKELERLEF
ncbi:MAG: DUF835 domain-containing protein [Thermococcus sp.]|nr:DUF835 domain-containing protein [Thermococcus sp.]